MPTRRVAYYLNLATHDTIHVSALEKQFCNSIKKSLVFSIIIFIFARNIFFPEAINSM